MASTLWRPRSPSTWIECSREPMSRLEQKGANTNDTTEPASFGALESQRAWPDVVAAAIPARRRWVCSGRHADRRLWVNYAFQRGAFPRHLQGRGRRLALQEHHVADGVDSWAGEGLLPRRWIGAELH